MTGRRRSLFGYDPNALDRPNLGPSAKEESLTVSQVTAMVRQRLEREFRQIVVVGELSNVVHAASGHLYANLKDGKSQIAMVMWRTQKARLNFEVEDGVEVVVTGRLSLYEPRGSFQLIAASMVAEGTGNLEAQFRALKARYEELGWFDPAQKLELPFLPETIGVVTSSAGAAIHDILQTILGRFPKAHLRLIPVRVQGAGSSEEIAAAIDHFCATKACDVLIVGRGGGSIEDLWAFNEEPVVEAIHRAKIPVISAVGHETDVTLSDLVADHRALTPTAAGEVVVPILEDLEDDLGDSLGRLNRVVNHQMASAQNSLNALARSWALREPLNYLRRVEQRLDELGRTLNRVCSDRLAASKKRLEVLGETPGRLGLLSRLTQAQEGLARGSSRLDGSMNELMKRAANDLDFQRRLLEGLSPLSVLERGYSITRTQDGKIVRRADDLTPGDQLNTRFADGEAASTVTKISREDEANR